MTDMGRWAYLLIGAELGGGRETAMLSGGAAGIPAWWMAFTSLMLSVVTLFVIYPMLYKLYHNETDDMLARQHTKALIADTINETAKRLSINVDWELYVAEEREVSIDIMVPFQFSDGTLSDVDDVRDAILRAILEEFAIFRIYKPVQLTVRPVGDGPLPDMETGIGVGGDNQRGGCAGLHLLLPRPPPALQGGRGRSWHLGCLLQRPTDDASQDGHRLK